MSFGGPDAHSFPAACTCARRRGVRLETVCKRTRSGMGIPVVDHLSKSTEASTLIPLLGMRGQSAFWGA